MNEPGTVTIAASGPSVLQDVVGSQGLSWLADVASSEKRPGGRVHLLRHAADQAIGHWEAYDPPTRATLRVRMEEQPRATSFAFQAEAAAGDVPAGPWSRPWRHALEDLGRFCQTGRAGRETRCPLRGATFDEVTAGLARGQGLSVGAGLRVAR